MAQRQRREREAQGVGKQPERLAQAPHSPEAEQGTQATTAFERHSLGQKRRRERERQQREAHQPPTTGPGLAAHEHEPTPGAMEIDEPLGPQHIPAPQQIPAAIPPQQFIPPQIPAEIPPQQFVPPPVRPDLPLTRRPYVEPASRHDLGRMDVACPHCNALHWKSERLASSSNRNPAFGMCCDQGQVRIPALRDPPEALRNLFEARTPEAVEFRTNIRQYNAALAFTSLGVNVDCQVNNGRGPYVFHVHGELSHQIGDLMPTEGRQPVYAQLYIYDPRAALDERMQRNHDLNRRTMDKLQTILLQHHCYSALFRHAYEVLAQQPADSPISIRLLADPTRDQRRYNLPTVSEIAAIVPGDGTQVTDSRDIVLHRRTGPLQRIHDGHRSYACLHYVLFFPHGEDGWHWDLTMHQPDKEKPNRLSQVRYAAFRLFSCETEFSVILRGSALFSNGWWIHLLSLIRIV